MYGRKDVRLDSDRADLIERPAVRPDALVQYHRTYDRCLVAVKHFGNQFFVRLFPFGFQRFHNVCTHFFQFRGALAFCHMRDRLGYGIAVVCFNVGVQCFIHLLFCQRKAKRCPHDGGKRFFIGPACLFYRSCGKSDGFHQGFAFHFIALLVLQDQRDAAHHRVDHIHFNIVDLL